MYEVTETELWLNK